MYLYKFGSIAQNRIGRCLMFKDKVLQAIQHHFPQLTVRIILEITYIFGTDNKFVVGNGRNQYRLNLVSTTEF